MGYFTNVSIILAISTGTRFLPQTVYHTQLYLSYIILESMTYPVQLSSQRNSSGL